MSRHNWEFYFTASDLHDAAQQRVDYHTQRLNWWTNELNKTTIALRETGVEFRERQQTGGVRIETILDPELSNRLSECRYKVEAHRTALQEFMTYAGLFKNNAGTEFPLSLSDVQYFKLFDSPTEEQE